MGLECFRAAYRTEREHNTMTNLPNDYPKPRLNQTQDLYTALLPRQNQSAVLPRLGSSVTVTNG